MTKETIKLPAEGGGSLEVTAPDVAMLVRMKLRDLGGRILWVQPVHGMKDACVELWSLKATALFVWVLPGREGVEVMMPTSASNKMVDLFASLDDIAAGTHPAQDQSQHRVRHGSRVVLPGGISVEITADHREWIDYVRAILENWKEQRSESSSC